MEQAASSPLRRAEPRTTASRGGETGCCCGLSASRVGGSSPAPLERARNELQPSPDAAESRGGVGGSPSPVERSGDAAGGTGGGEAAGGGGEAAAFAAGSGGGELIPEAARVRAALQSATHSALAGFLQLARKRTPSTYGVGISS